MKSIIQISIYEQPYIVNYIVVAKYQLYSILTELVAFEL